MNKVAILLGNNIDDGRDYLLEARYEIDRQIGKIIHTSSVYTSPPWGYQSINAYKNQVVVCNSNLSAVAILHMIFQIEKSLGRIRNNSSLTYQDRTIDIDILLFNTETIQLEQLEIPHPRMHLRKFCLLPLAQITPEWIVPTFHCSVNDLLVQCEDKSEVKRID
jgi:2-amino-4-hydroxy-6-hydroxymethyldihydropteridine diphosphokinase